MAMSDRQKKRQRTAFRGASVESLEGRQLLSNVPAIHALTHSVAAYSRWQMFLANHPRYAARLNVSVPAITPASTTVTGSTSYAGAGHHGVSAQTVSIPENASTFRGIRFPNYPAALTPPATPGPYSLRANFHPGLQGRTQFGGGVITALSVGQYGGTATTPTPAGTAATGNSATPPGLLTTGTTGQAPGFPGAPIAMPAPGGMLGIPANVTLSAGDVNSLKTTVDTFANSYTDGKDSVADKAAVTALKAGLDDLSQSVWSETHVAAKSDIATLQKAMTDFAANYTGGTNLAQDKAAWKAFHTSLHTFSQALKNPSAPATTTTATGTTTTPTPTIAPLPGGAAPGFMAWGGNRGGIADPLFAGAPLTSDEVNSIKTAVDTFATNYTSGKNATTDTTAVADLSKALSTVLQQHWMATPMLNQPTTGITTAAGSQSTPATPPLFPGGPGHYTLTRDSVTVPASATPNGLG